MSIPESDLPISTADQTPVRQLPTTLPAPEEYFYDENQLPLSVSHPVANAAAFADTPHTLRMEVQHSLRLLAASPDTMADAMSHFLEECGPSTFNHHIVDSYRYLGELTSAFVTRKLHVPPENAGVINAAVASMNEKFLFEVKIFLNTLIERLNRLLSDIQKDGISNLLMPFPGGFEVSKVFENELSEILDDFLQAYNVLSVEVLSSLSDEYRQVKFDHEKVFDHEILIRFKQELDPSSPAYDLFASALPTRGSGLEEIYDTIMDYQSLKDITESEDHADVQKMRLKIYRLLKFYFMHIKNSLAAQCAFAIHMADNIFDSEAEKAEMYLTVLNKIVRVGAFAQLILQLLEQKTV